MHRLQAVRPLVILEFTDWLVVIGGAARPAVLEFVAVWPAMLDRVLALVAVRELLLSFGIM